jgi:hypothetical protein
MGFLLADAHAVSASIYQRYHSSHPSLGVAIAELRMARSTSQYQTAKLEDEMMG